MKSLLLTTLLIVCSVHLYSKEIPLDQAEQYAVAAYKLYAEDNRKSSDVVIESHATHLSSSEASYYLFNIQGGGFVILSADDRYHPVLGFSTDEHLDLSNQQAVKILKGELSRHEIQIVQSRKRNIKASNKATSSWAKIKEVAQAGRVTKNNTFQPTVAPLTTTKWDQDGYYNASCPADAAGPGGRTYCGCLPIALSQLLKYYENPAPGNGSRTYVDANYGTQEVDICGQQFDYANMPDELTEPNQILNDFIYDVGKITVTQYSTSYTATYVSRLENTLIYNYSFDSDIQAYHGTDQARYSSVLKSELDQDRIVFLAAWSIDAQQNADIGHTWLADGYGSTDTGVEYMHFNWGWGGSNNGWFLDVPGAWTPHPDNPEQAVVNYYWYRYTLYNIKPSGEVCTPPQESLPTAEGFEHYAYLYFQSPMVDELRQYRYREAGDAGWITSGPTDAHYLFAGDLTPGTTYEYQVARNCCGGWSSFSPTKEFATLGTTADPDPDPDDTGSDCTSESVDQLFVTSVSDHFAYIYTTRPHGQVNNQFRYKKVSDDTWSETDISTSHYRALTTLDIATAYEYQVRHECTSDSWSAYSESYIFNTTGMSSGDDQTGDGNDDTGDTSDSTCPTIPTEDFALGYATRSGATAYLLRVSGGQMYRFRYRVTGSNATWVETSETSGTSQNFSGLTSSTNYEIQMAQNCGSGWSEYSEGKTISTL